MSALRPSRLPAQEGSPLFTLYFIPVIPLNLIGEYVECGSCRGTYRPEVLDYAPTNTSEFASEFELAMRRVMALVVLADGVVDDAEVETMRDIYRSLAKEVLSDEAARREIEAARSDGKTVFDYLKGVVGMLNDGGKELVVQAALMIAAADGEFQAEEKDLIMSIGKALQMSPAHINKVIRDGFSGAEA